MPSKVIAVSQPASSGTVQQSDVVLGSGLAGSISGACLAGQGARVVLIDAAQHPRFAVGESMTPQLVEWLHILASRFDVPEIGHLLDVKSVARHIGPMHGKKQNFGFIKHEPGQEPDPEQANMFVIPKILTEASHLFRQDTDQYFFNVAAKHGCVTRQNWRAQDLDFDDDGVTVTGQNGEVFRAKYLIDASGFRSPLAQKFDLREQPTRFKHHARGMFTHYIGIRPFDEVSHHPLSTRPPVPWHVEDVQADQQVVPVPEHLPVPDLARETHGPLRAAERDAAHHYRAQDRQGQDQPGRLHLRPWPVRGLRRARSLRRARRPAVHSSRLVLEPAG
jgi:tetracycline 7-halogenase / FADH2 O2-dependent halogenase